LKIQKQYTKGMIIITQKEKKKRNETKRNETKQNKTKQNKTKQNEKNKYYSFVRESSESERKV